MLLFFKSKILIIVFCFLLQYINLTNYISLKIRAVDDCVRYINISNQIILNFSEPIDANSLTCYANIWEKDAPDDFLIKDYEYEFKKRIEITFEDWNIYHGFMAIDVYFNEYVIKCTDQTFWKCINCYNNKTEKGEFDFGTGERWINGEPTYEKVFLFHPKIDNIDCCPWLPHFYTFVFEINDITELYKGGINGPFEIITDYYTFGNESQIIIEKKFNYSRNSELELINFKQDDIIFAKTNISNSILVYKNNNDFIYKICVENKEGQLKGLDQKNSEINVNIGDCFLETSGINYKLGDKEKKECFTEVKLKISVFKICPEDTNVYKYCNNKTPIIEEKDFIFKIIGPPLETIAQTTILVDSTEQITTLTYFTEQTSTLTYSSEQMTMSKDFAELKIPPTDSTEQSLALIELFNKKIILNDINKIEQQEMINDIDSAIISHRIESLLNNLTNDNFEDLIIIFENIKYHLTSSLNQKVRIYKDISTIHLGECENILKNQYNITQSDTLIIFKIDVLNQTSIPVVLYQVYHAITKERLNLSYCNDIVINVSYPVNINEKELFKYDPSNDFYSDICSTYTTEFQTDITLKDRQKEYIDKNLSLCEEDCHYNNYDIETKKVTCECYIKISFPIISEIVINKNKLMKKFMNIKETINLKIMKCYKLLFTKEGIATNIGSYFLLFIILLFILSTIIFPFKSYEIIHKKVKNIYDQKLSESKSSKQNKKIKNEKIPEENNHKINRNDKETMTIEINNNSPPKKEEKRRKRHKIKSNLNLNKSENRKIIRQKKNTILKADNIKMNVTMNYNDYELNMLEYKDALIFDKRSYSQFYISLLKTKHILIFTFFNINDYNSMVIKICLFLFFISLNLTINALFFSDSTIHEIYMEKGEYNFIYQLPQIIYSTIIISFINIIVKYLSLTEKTIINFKKEQSNEDLGLKMEELIKCLKIKFIIFYVISYIFLIFFWYYLACFCAVYKNTQICFIKDSVISFAISLTYPFGLYLIPGIFRITSIKNNNKKTMYEVSQIIQLLL